jgi:predicted ArsR family transcriptional regulator
MPTQTLLFPRLATRTTPREMNCAIVLDLVRHHEPISRADLARRLDVPRSALTVIVRDLVARGAITESSERPPRPMRGRRPTMLRVAAPAHDVAHGAVRVG